MSIKKVDITIPKIDYQVIALSIKENGQNIQLQEGDLLYFTISSSPDTTDYKIQKSIGNGIEYNAETEKYEVTIQSSDTKDMTLNTDYGYDITIYYDGNKPKQKVIGKFVITDKYTMNEVS